MATVKVEPPYVHKEYPRYLYHASAAPRTVSSLEDRIALGPGWFESAGETAAAQAAEAAATLRASTEAEALYAMSATGVMEHFADASVEVLLRAKEQEMKNPKTPRVSVLRFLEAALSPAVK
jgi:hypothetical protein